MSRKGWFTVSNHMDRSAADVYVYDEIGSYGITAMAFAQEINGLNVSTINLKINSPGGEVFDGVAIYNALKSHRATVNVTVDALAASAASFIAMAGDKVTMARGAEIMIHKAQGICMGDDTDMLALGQRLAKMNDKIASFYAERAGGDLAHWGALMAAETWFTGPEAVLAGLADVSEEPELEGPPDVEGPDEPVENAYRGWRERFKYANREEAPVVPVEDQRVEPFGAFIAALTGGGHQ
jgi:ATP-dependent protease ClpP protease subunit